MRTNNRNRLTNRKDVTRMTENRMESRVANTIADAVHTYQDHSGEAVLVATAILSGLVDADVKYFEGPAFRLHCDLLPDMEHVKLDHAVLLPQIRKLYR